MTNIRTTTTTTVETMVLLLLRNLWMRATRRWWFVRFEKKAREREKRCEGRNARNGTTLYKYRESHIKSYVKNVELVLFHSIILMWPFNHVIAYLLVRSQTIFRQILVIWQISSSVFSCKVWFYIYFVKKGAFIKPNFICANGNNKSCTYSRDLDECLMMCRSHLICQYSSLYTS